MSTVFPSAAAVLRYFSEEGGLAHSFDGDMREHVSEPYRYSTSIQQDKSAVHVVAEFEDPDRHGAYFEFGIHILKYEPKLYRVITVILSFSGVATHDTKTISIPEGETDLATEIMKRFRPLAAEFIQKDVGELHVSYRRQMNRAGDSHQEEVTDEYRIRADKLKFIKKFISTPATPPIKESIQNILREPDED